MDKSEYGFKGENKGNRIGSRIGNRIGSKIAPRVGETAHNNLNKERFIRFINYSNALKYPGEKPRSIKWNIHFPTQRSGKRSREASKIGEAN